MINCTIRRTRSERSAPVPSRPSMSARSRSRVFSVAAILFIMGCSLRASGANRKPVLLLHSGRVHPKPFSSKSTSSPCPHEERRVFEVAPTFFDHFGCPDERKISRSWKKHLRNSPPETSSRIGQPTSSMMRNICERYCSKALRFCTNTLLMSTELVHGATSVRHDLKSNIQV
jgi:hypothetical protein